MRAFLDSLLGPRLRRGLLLFGALLLLCWLLFFDSHNVWQRIQLNGELDRLHEENAALEERIDRLEDDLSEVASDETVERVAREEYGMRRDGETVYRTAPGTGENGADPDAR